MKITSSTNTTITGIRPKVIETANGFLLNTQYYTKEKLAPIPFENCNLQGSPYSLSIRKQLFLQGYTWNYPNDEFNIVKDSRYENRYYMRTLEGYVSGSRSSKLITFEETENGEIKILNVYNPGDYQFLEFVGQNDSYIWWTLRSNTSFYLYRMDKITYTVVSCWSSSTSYNYGKLKQIYSDDIYIYFIYFAQQNIYTLKYDKVNNSTSVSQAIYRGKETTAYNYYLTNISDTPYQIDDNTYGLFLFNAADATQPIDLYQYDTTKTITDGFTMQSVTITWNSTKTKFDFLTTSIYCTIRNFISEFNGIKYLNVVTYQPNFDNANYIPVQGIYTFRIDSATNLVFTGYNQIDGAKQIGGFIYDESKEHLIVAKQNAFQILKFNQTTFKYESTNFEITGCYSVGLDELQRVWYIKTDSSVHMINLEDAQSVEIEFEKEYYDYTGSTISTYINFSALNYLGEDFAGVFELTISGPAVFTENNTNTLRFDYTGTGKQQIGITITGASPVTIYPKFIS
jgi:hypothetical protein